jgi:GNAT superfamily N-acetyltransferase
VIELRPASSLSLEARAAVLNAAYSDYLVPLQVTPDQMASMDELYDVDLRRSVVAFARETPVGLALLSQRRQRGWISAVGVAPSWREHGIARQMMRHLIREAGQAGIIDLSLEVISENAPARRLYDSLGFLARRELLTWRFPPDGGPLPVPPERLFELGPAQVLPLYAAWHTEDSSWQRELASLERMADRLRAYRLDMDGRQAAYCLVSDRGEAVSILDVGINPDFGPVRAGRVLLQALWFLYRGRALTMMNVPADDGLSRALAALHFLVTIRQIEMALPARGFASPQ